MDHVPYRERQEQIDGQQRVDEYDRLTKQDDSAAPAELAHHFVLLHYECGDMDSFRLSGSSDTTAEMAAWLCRLCARYGVAAVTYAGAEQAWPATDTMDIAADLADTPDDLPF